MLDDEEERGDGDIFWTDIEQARVRLLGTIVLYKDLPVLVNDIVSGRGLPNPRIPRAFISDVEGEGRSVRKRLDSPHFNRFRDLPKLGWVNSRDGKAFFVERVPARIQQHGINTSNTCVYRFNDNFALLDPGRADLARTFLNKYFKMSHQGLFPSLESILSNIQEGEAVAFNRDCCVVRDELGMRWLYYKTRKVGMFSGADTVVLASKFSYLRETLQDEPTFTVGNIAEF